MICADLHVHSKASKRPSEWFLQKVGAKESYTDVETIYKNAKQSGMNFVTLTDHNTIEGALELVTNYPEDTFISVELTTYFPENRCKIHVLAFDITPAQFKELNEIRQDIYRLRNYIRDHHIAYSVAHGFYSINKRLDIPTLEKLILLFDVFETRNGARNRQDNDSWQTILKKLTPAHIKQLQNHYGIDPISDDPWVKGFTGGSDDHAGLFIGQTGTILPDAADKDDFIQKIREKKTDCFGRCNNYKSFAFTIYKIFCEYSIGVGNKSPGGVLSFINSVVFNDRQYRLKQWAMIQKIKNGKNHKDKILLKFFEDIYDWSKHPTLDMESRIERVYHSMGILLDEFFKLLLDSFVKDFSKGDVGKMFKNLLSAFPALFISIPFFSSLKHLSQDRETILALKEKYFGQTNISRTKALWFSDTFVDLNGVSVTLNKFKQQAVRRNLNITFATCLPENDTRIAENPENILCLPCIDSITPEFYSNYTLHFPSLLASVEIIYNQQPDRIIVSTPGPVGILGMAMAAVLGIECICIYHTDFSAQAEHLFKDETISGLIQSGTNRFYSFATHIKVPTQEYISILEEQHYDPDKMSIFKRGIDIPSLNPDPVWRKNFRRKAGLKKGMTLMWAGRVSKDKNIDFLLTVYEQACCSIQDLNLVICGDGPDLQHYKDHSKNMPGIRFTGFIDQETLGRFYEYSDLFVFPSTTDTFGMVILEAQSWGLPVLVTDVGGPQEIIKDLNTGFILDLSTPQSWVSRIKTIHALKTENPNEYAMMRARCQQHIQQRFNWDEALFDLLGAPVSGSKKPSCDHPVLKENFETDAGQNEPPVVYSKKVVA